MTAASSVDRKASSEEMTLEVCDPDAPPPKGGPAPALKTRPARAATDPPPHRPANAHNNAATSATRGRDGKPPPGPPPAHVLQRAASAKARREKSPPPPQGDLRPKLSNTNLLAQLQKKAPETPGQVGVLAQTTSPTTKQPDAPPPPQPPAPAPAPPPEDDFDV